MNNGDFQFPEFETINPRQRVKTAPRRTPEEWVILGLLAALVTVGLILAFAWALPYLNTTELGTWVDPGPGPTSGWVYTLSLRDGKTFLSTDIGNGTVDREVRRRGGVYHIVGQSDNGDRIRINDRGELEFHDNLGLITTCQPRE